MSGRATPRAPCCTRSSWSPCSGRKGHRLRPPGEAERGLIQAYIDDLLVVAHTLQHFVDGVEAVAAYLGMMGMELDKQSNRQITEENSSGTILKHVKSVESVLCDKHKFSSHVSN